MNSSKVVLPLPRPPMIVLRNGLNWNLSGSVCPMCFDLEISNSSTKYDGGSFGMSSIFRFTDTTPSLRASSNPSMEGVSIFIQVNVPNVLSLKTVGVGSFDFSPSQFFVRVYLGFRGTFLAQLHGVSVFVVQRLL